MCGLSHFNLACDQRSRRSSGEIPAMKAYLVMFGRYNAWANGRLYDAAAALPDADFRADRGALNHWLPTEFGCGVSRASARRPTDWTPARAILTGLLRRAPELDLLYFQRLIGAWAGRLKEWALLAARPQAHAGVS
jgi:hypothetical protein